MNIEYPLFHLIRHSLFLVPCSIFALYPELRFVVAMTSYPQTLNTCLITLIRFTTDHRRTHTFLALHVVVVVPLFVIVVTLHFISFWLTWQART